MKSTLSSLIVAVALGCSALSAPVIAQQTTAIQLTTQQAGGGVARIEYSRQLRVLFQIVHASACHLTADIDRDGAEQLLGFATTQLDATLNALELGDAELNVADAETSRTTIAAIQNVRDMWAPHREAALAILQGKETDENLNQLAAENTELLEAIELLVVQMVNGYYNPNEMVSADSFLVDIAGRQRMLIQNMSKNACLIATDRGTSETLDQLEDTMTVFAASLSALSNGLPGAGIRRPPTAAIEEGLVEVLRQWNAVKPMLDSIAAGSGLDRETATRRFQDMNVMTATMNKVVDMYSVATLQTN